MSIKTNLTVDQGANFIYNIYLIDVNGDPFNITGYTGNSQIRRTYTSNSYVTMSVAVTGNTGLISLSMNASTTSSLTHNRYVYDVELLANSVVSRIVEGIVTVNPGVTR